MRENLWGFNGNQKTPFLKIILNDPKVLARARSVLEQGEVQFLDMFNGPTLTFESNIAFLLRFMIDTKVTHLSFPTHIYTLLLFLSFLSCVLTDYRLLV